MAVDKPPPAPVDGAQASSPGPDAAAAARRSALVSVAVCVATLLGADALFRASGLGRALHRESWYITRPEIFSADPGPVDILGIGDSRIGNAFNPAVVQQVVQAERGETLRAWNGSLPGAPPMAQLAWVERMLSRPRRARVVVLGISPYVFSAQIARAPSREALTTIYRVTDVPAVLRAGGSIEDGFTVLQANAFASHRVRPRVIDVLLGFHGTRDAASTGTQGFEDHPGADRPTQAARANARVAAYRNELQRPGARFGSEQQGYFVETLRTLRAHGVTTLVLDSLAASQMDAALGPDSIYPEHIAWVRAQARAYGATFVDVRHPPSIDDGDFGDVDHVSTEGSVRFSAWFAHTHLVPALGGRRPDRPAGCRTVFDLEDPLLPGWLRRGDAMVAPVVFGPRRGQQTTAGHTGQRYLTTFTEGLGDASMGEATSPLFPLDGATLRVRVAGGRDPALGVDVLVNGQMVGTVRGDDSEVMRDGVIDVRAYRGQTAALRVRDMTPGGWGHLQVDDVALCPE